MDGSVIYLECWCWGADWGCCIQTGLLSVDMHGNGQGADWWAKLMWVR